MESAGIADRAALLAREKMVGWYVGNFGFEDHGESSVKYAGGGWRDLVILTPFVPTRDLRGCWR